MELEKQVCSLDLAKRLKELGVKQESAFCWAAVMETPDTNWRLWHSGSVEEWVGAWRYAAFTVAELGEMLPDKLVALPGVPGVSWLVWDKIGEKYSVIYKHFFDPKTHIRIIFDANSEADARAKMLIYLLERKLIPERFDERQDGAASARC